MPRCQQENTADVLSRTQTQRIHLEHRCALLAQLQAIQECCLQGIKRLAVQGDSRRIQRLCTAEVEVCLWEGHLHRHLPILEVQ
jgi:hypothetical protein